MVEEDIERPFPAYEGDEKYIFVSYAHKDRSIVFPEIKRFHDERFPIWYDDGLTPGQEWDDEIAIALMNCSLLVVFISKNSMDSTNVQDEIKLALNREIDVVPIYLERTELPPALELRLSNKHAIFKHSLKDGDYIGDCLKAFNKAGIPRIEAVDAPKEDEGIDSNGSLTLFSLPDPAYDGREPYIFVSYAHEDSSRVFPEIKRFQDLGYNVWYNPGLTPRGKWLGGIEYTLLECSVFVVFMSDNAVESEQVRNEIFLAFDVAPVLPIYLEETELKYGLKLRLRSLQSIFKYQMSDEEYVQSITKAFETHGLNETPKIDIFGIDYSFRNPDCPIYALAERIYPYCRRDNTDFSGLSDEDYFLYETIAINALCLVKASGRNFYINGSDIHLDLSNADNWDTFKEARLLFVGILKNLGWREGIYDYDKKTVHLSLFGGSLVADDEERHMQRIIKAVKKAGCS